MSLEELLADKLIYKIEKDHNLESRSITHAKRDIETAKVLLKNGRFDWAVITSYNAMLQLGRSVMFGRGYRPSSNEGHKAVIAFLREEFKNSKLIGIITMMDSLRKKRHIVVYDEIDVISKSEAEKAVKWAEEFFDIISK